MRARRRRIVLSLVLLLSALTVRAPAEPARAGAPAEGRVASIQAAVDTLARWVSTNGGRLSAMVARVDNGRPLAGHGADVNLNPASNVKILTAAVALDQLGPSYQFVTGLHGDIENGAIDALVLRGHGDPSLRTADLWRLANALANRGIKKIGRILVDQSRFDAKFVPPAFEQQPDEWAAFRAPVSAVALEQNAVTLNVLATTEGQPARTWFEPSGFVEVSGEIRTTAAGGGQDVRLTLKQKGDRLHAMVSGHVAEGLPRVRFKRRVDDPRLFPGYVFAHLLEEAGIEVKGPVALGGADQKQRISYIESAPLSALLQRLGKRSDNFYAEMILKTLGAEAGKRPARSKDGAAVVQAWLDAAGADSPGTRIVNGSGLFDANRLSASTLVEALRHAYNSPEVGSDFVAHLSIGGVDGTLKSRFRNRNDRRAVRAKTGTLNRAIALSGYVLAPPRKAAVAFSFLVDGIAGKHWDIRRRIDRCVEAIAEHVWG